MERVKDTNSIIYAIVCFAVLLLFVSQYIIIGVGVVLACIACLLIKKQQFKLRKVCLFFFAFLGINLIQAVFIPKGDAVQEIERNFIYLLLSLLLCNIRVPYKSFLNIWRVMLAFCFAVQVFQFFKLFGVNDILTRVYGNSEFLRLANYSSLRYFRSGSVFVSINPYFKLTAVSLVVFLYDIGKGDSNRFIDYLFIFVAVLSTFLSGSRTGIIIIAIILMIYFFGKMGKKIDVKSVLFSLTAIVSFILLVMFLNYRYNLVDARVFSAGDSLSYKITMVKKYISEAGIRELLIGMGPYNVDVTGLHMDSDLGFALSYYGLIGVVVYYIMLAKLVNLTKYSKKLDKTYLFMILVILIASGITSGVYFHFRVFSTILLALIPFQTSIASDRGYYDSHSTIGDGINE